MKIVIGDTHFRSSNPFWTGQVKFLEFLHRTYAGKADLLFLGDLFDSSSPRWNVYRHVQNFLSSWPGTVDVIHGNHEYSKLKGSALEGLSKFENITIHTQAGEIKDQDLNLLALPFQYDLESRKAYEALTGDYDYIFTHITPIECQFGEEGTQLGEKLRAKKIVHGHTHISVEFEDKYGHDHLVLGVPYPTRQGEQFQVPYLLEVGKDHFKRVPIPLFFTIEDVQFDEEPTSKDNLLNIRNAPSVNSAFERYPLSGGYYLREEGISLKLYTPNGETQREFSVGKAAFDMKTKFLEFAKKEEIGVSHKNYILEKLDAHGG